MTTIVTVGYGDYFPKSDFGRIFTMLLLYTFGIGAMGIIIGKIFESFSKYRKLKGGREIGLFRKRTLYINWFFERKIGTCGEEILGSEQKCDVVLVDNAERTPLEHDRLHFVSGNPAEEEVLMKANILEAKSVAIFSDDRNDGSEYSDGKTLTHCFTSRAYFKEI